ncbi:MAG: acyltransferase family protein [Syntrophomonadaceae bacterium]
MERDENIGLTQGNERDQLHSRRYMPGLDGLRALAVLAVIAYHLHLPWAPGGLLGVCIFFVLSGYLITDILLSQWSLSASLNLKEFWRGRIRRLGPAMFTMLGGVMVWVFFYDPSRLSALWNEVLAAAFYSSNWWLIFHKVSYFANFGPPSPLGHLWSLSVEGQFYVLWPLLLGLALRYIHQRGRLIGLISALIIASAAAMAVIYQPGLDPNRVYYGTDTRAFALLVGAVLALLWPSRRLSARLSLWPRMTLDIAGGAALLAILAMIWRSNQYQSFLYYGGLLLFSVIAAVLVAVLAHPASRLGRLFGISPLRWLGVWSYGIYLWHYPVIILTSPVINTGGPNIGLAITQTVLSISLAAISWYFIEEPIRHGIWSQHWEQFANGLRLRPRLGPFWGKVSLTRAICISGALILAVSGFTMISQAQQKGSPSELVGTREPVTTALQPDLEEGNGNGPQAPSAVETVNEGADQNHVNIGREITVIDDSALVGENSSNGAEIPLAAETFKQNADRNHEFAGKGVTVIGDSVMVGVEAELKMLFPDIIVDAAIGRQMYEAPQVIKNLQAHGILGKTVIIELGANGAFTEKQFMDILGLLGDGRRIVAINARVPKPWESSVNQVLAQMAETYPNVELVDWYSASRGHNEYFRADGVHVEAAGVKAYVSLLANALTPEP